MDRPVWSVTLPVDPALAVPVLNIICPLTPVTPAFGVEALKYPLVVLVLYPVTKDIYPPVEISVVVPARTLI